MRKNFFICCIFLIISIPFFGKSTPKLVVFITIDELHSEHLLILNNKLGKFGLNQFINKGTFFSNANYSCVSTFKGSRLTNFYTGTTPATHGLISDFWINPQTQEENKAFEVLNESSLSDSILLEMNTAKIQSSTFADQLFLINKKKSLAATIGLNALDHAFFSNNTHTKQYWFNTFSGNFISRDTTNNPKWLETFNNMNFAKTYSEKQWGPIAALNQYQEYKTNGNHEARHFMHSLSSNSAIPFSNLVNSPYANVMVRDLAASLILHENYGKDEFTDLLALSFTCKPFTNENPELFDAEVEDMLLRLDEQIESLTNVIKDNVGLENTLFILSSTPTTHFSAETLKSIHVSTGVFNGKKTSALLNLYLMAIYGQGKWVIGYHDKQFYLNQKLIKEKNISFEELQSKASEFLLEVSGIKETISGKDIRTQEYSTGFFSLVQKSYFFGRSGDLFISLKPGWVESSSYTEKNKTIGNRFNIPLIFYGWKTKGEKIFHPVKMEDVASTVCAILNIPPPNGNSGIPIPEITKSVKTNQ